MITNRSTFPVALPENIQRPA